MAVAEPEVHLGGRIDDLVASGLLHPECSQIFRIKRDDGTSQDLALHRHQVDAIEAARSRESYVLTTGTGSGKSLAYIIPIVDTILRQGPGKGIKAVVVYPMNALANSQEEELRKFVDRGYPGGKGPVRFERYTGQESDEKRNEVVHIPAGSRDVHPHPRAGNWLQSRDPQSPAVKEHVGGR